MALAALVKVSEPMTFPGVLARLIELDRDKKAAKKRLDSITEEMEGYKEVCRDQFVDMSIDSIKSGGKTIYLQNMLWTGVAENVDPIDAVNELKALGLSQYCGVGTQAISGYVRELAKDNPEFCDAHGNITASPDEILALLPGKLPELLKIIKKTDIKVKS